MDHPFHYSPVRGRIHGPKGYRDYGSYRPWLRDEFAFRCVYCLLREQWGRVRGTFDIDHFDPVAQKPSRALVYDNLVYACAACNNAKSNQPLPDLKEAMNGATVQVEEDGTIRGLTADARVVIDTLGLDDQEMTEFRALWIGIVALAFHQDRALYNRLMSFPDNLPDLSRLKPPGGNSKPQGIAESHLVRREQGVLPGTY